MTRHQDFSSIEQDPTPLVATDEERRALTYFDRLAIATQGKSIPLLSTALQLDWQTPPPSGEEWYYLSFAADSDRFAVHVPVETIEAALGLLGYELESFPRDPKTKQLLCRFALLETLDRLSGLWGRSVELLDVRQASEVSETFGMPGAFVQPAPKTIALDFILDAAPDVIGKIIELAADEVSDEDTSLAVQAIPQHVALISCPFQMSLTDLRALQTSDIILLDNEWSLHSHRQVFINRTLSARCDPFGDGEWQLIEELNQNDPAAGNGGSLRMDEKDDIRQLDQLPITLTIELDQTTKTLAEIEELSTGSLVTFNAAQPQTVRVLANGQPFAEGQLIEIENQYGVRLSRIA